MIKRFRLWSIRSQLTILIALLAVPSMSLIAYSGIVERRNAIAGANCYVTKPAGYTELLETVKELCRKCIPVPC